MRQRLAQLFSDDDLTIAAAFYGSLAAFNYELDRLMMDPEAVLLDLRDSLAIRISEENQAKVLAGIACATTDLIYKDLEAFIRFCNLATDSDVSSPEVFDPADIYEIAWGRVEIAMVDPTGEEEELVTDGRNPFLRESSHKPKATMTFSEDILRYCGAVLYQEGAIRPIFSIPDAVMTKAVAIDEPAFYAAARGRHDTVEKDVAAFVMDNLTILLDQLGKIPTQRGEPLMTPEIAQGIIESLTFSPTN